MPVQIVDDDALLVSKFRRLSATSLIQYRGCPRSWYHQRIEFLRGPQVPAMMRGHIVENTVCRVLRESPILVASDADWQILESPLDSDERPDRENTERYLAPGLGIREPVEDLESLRVWMRARVGIHFPMVKESHVEDFEDHPMSIGDVEDFDDEQMMSMINATLDFHLEEVEKCLSENGGPKLSDFRAGNRPEWPAPDGYPHNWSQPHPSVTEGDCTLMEAWEIARPWFVDPNAPPFSLNVIHPEHWFQGEYDLVYRHGGKIRIMDLKASRGGGDRSGNYVEQLRIYAMLWSITHSGEIPDALEVWYLGVNVRKSIEVPNAEEIISMENKLSDLWHEIKESEITVDDCPTIPRPLRGYSEGGVKVEDPEEIRCSTCDWAGLCPSGTGDDDLPEGGQHQPPGDIKVYDLTAFGDLKPRINIFCEVFSATKVPDKAPNLTIEKDGGFAFVRIVAEESEGALTYPHDVEKGDTVRLIGVVPSTNWKGELQLKVDPHARIEKASQAEDGDIGLFDFQARCNVAGRVAYTTYKSGVGRNGKPWTRKGIVLLDNSGRIAVEGWDNAWPSVFNTLKQGDEIAVLNVSLDAWAIDVKANLEKGSTLHVLSRADEN